MLLLIYIQAFIGTGFNLVLTFNPLHSFDPRLRQMDFEKEPGKVREKNPKHFEQNFPLAFVLFFIPKFRHKFRGKTAIWQRPFTWGMGKGGNCFEIMDIGDQLSPPTPPFYSLLGKVQIWKKGGRGEVLKLLSPSTSLVNIDWLIAGIAPSPVNIYSYSRTEFLAAYFVAGYTTVAAFWKKRVGWRDEGVRKQWGGGKKRVVPYSCSSSGFFFSWEKWPTLFDITLWDLVLLKKKEKRK